MSPHPARMVLMTGGFRVGDTFEVTHLFIVLGKVLFSTTPKTVSNLTLIIATSHIRHMLFFTIFAFVLPFSLFASLTPSILSRAILVPISLIGPLECQFPVFLDHPPETSDL